MKPTTFKIRSREALLRVASMLSKMLVSEDRPLLVEVSDFKAPKTRQQEKLFHAILGDVAEHVVVDGKRFTAKAWKHYFVEKYVGTEEMILPTGEIVLERKSTTGLKVDEYAKLIDQTLAELASEHGYMSEAAA